MPEKDYQPDGEAASGHLRAGQIIAPWISLGPFYEDVSSQVRGLTRFERSGSDIGGELLDDIVAEADPLLRATPREGDGASFRGQAHRWAIARRPEQFLSWGEYFLTNHLAAIFLSTRLMAGSEGRSVRWRLVTRISSRAVVTVNGEIVIDTDALAPRVSAGGFEYHFTAPLQAGENVVTAGLFRLGRMGQVGFRLELVDDDAWALAPLIEHIAPAVRTQIEDALAGVSLERDILYPSDQLRVRVETAPHPSTRLELSLDAVGTGDSVARVSVTAAGSHIICDGAGLADGFYTLVCRWSDGDQGHPITSREFEIRKVSPVPVPEGDREERRDTLLQHFADARDGELLPRDVIWPEVARYAVGRYADVSEHGIRAACEFIAARSDCADFTIQGVLRILAWESAERRLPAELNELMKETVLGFKYWVDEPGDTVMFMGSENHRLAFHVAEWLAGTLFPLEEFSNSRQRGLFHAAKGRAYIVEWLRQRGRFGFDEWHSNAYFPVCLGPLANVYDFAIDEEYKLKQMTASVLDYMAFILAADTYRGIFGTTHGRSYTRYIKHPGMESTSAACWLWYGEGTLVRQTRGVMAPVTLGSGDYWPPPILHEIAADTSSVVESKQRQGLMRSGEQSANFSVFRTPDFLMSGLQDHRKGEYDSAIHAAQVTLPNEAVVFWSCPQTTGEGSGLRPDYWSGNTTLPRVIHHRNVMSLTWQPSTYAWMTHCFFERSRFDEIRERGNWVFGRSSDGYIGIYSQHGMSWGRDGQYAGRELICTTLPNTWIVECGRREDWGSFDGFVDALQDAPIETAGDVLTYRSPSLGEFRTGWSVEPSIDGGAIELRDYPMVESPWASAAFGSGELTVRYGESVEHLWFNQ